MSAHARCPNPACPSPERVTVSGPGPGGLCPACGSDLGPDDEDGAVLETRMGGIDEVRPSAPAPPPTRPAPPPSFGNLPRGSVFAGRYEIVDKLGRGGMGTVYLAHDNNLDRDVALKVPDTRGAGREFVERFLREARTGAQLSHHPNICRVIDVNQADGVPYLTMDCIEGQPLSGLLKQKGGRLSEPDATRIVRAMAGALDEAHSRGIVHRDLKPSNVMIKDDGTPVLMDFGLARRDSDERITNAGAILGTVAYMSPEQARGDNREIGRATDVYSLGVILYELLIGRRPFDGTEREVLKRIVVEDPTPPSAERPDLDPRLEAICLKAMAKTPASRHASMTELVAELDALSARETPPISIPAPKPEATPRPEPVIATPGPIEAPERPAPAARGSRRGPLIAAGIGVLAIAGLAVVLLAPKPSGEKAPPDVPKGVAAKPPEPGDAPAKPPVVDPSTVATATQPAPKTSDEIKPAAVVPGPRFKPGIASKTTGMSLVLIAPGTFEMGSPPGEGDEQPQHRVSISRAFYLGKHEVTHDEYRAVAVEKSGRSPGDGNLPAEQVSWLDAIRYCNALSLKDGLPEYYKVEGEAVAIVDPSAPGYRLPTEAEWEFACRAGSVSKYGFGDDEAGLDGHAWYTDNSLVDVIKQSHPVGMKAANGFGLYDMQGNVEEWCWDRYADRYDPRAPEADPTGPTVGDTRVIRGGHHKSPAKDLRVAARHKNQPIVTSRTIGFRIARTSSPGDAAK